MQATWLLHPLNNKKINRSLAFKVQSFLKEHYAKG
jgi:hypothetical protein